MLPDLLPTNPIYYLTPLVLVTLITAYFELRRYESDLTRKRQLIDQKIYEANVLGEISQKIGYDLTLEKIFEIMAASLNKVLPYTVVSYMVISTNQQNGKVKYFLGENVNKQFFEDIKKHMLDSLNTILDKKLSPQEFTENTTGGIVEERSKNKLASFWVIPLSANNCGFGVFSIAYKKKGYYLGDRMEFLNNIFSHVIKTLESFNLVFSSEEEKLTSMVGSMTDGVLMLTPAMELLVVNSAVIKLLGLPSDRKLTIYEIMSKLSDKIDLRTKIEESIHGDKLIVVDNLSINNKVTQLFISVVKNSVGKISGSLVLFHDISTQKELDRLRDEFTAMMVHELRAPLTVVRGAADMFTRDPSMATTSQGQELMKTLLTSATSMLSLVNDLLDAAKIEAGKFQILKTKGNLIEVIKDREMFFGQMAAPKSITIGSDLNLVELEADFDKDRISQVLNNLLSNAIKFTPLGGKINISAYKINSVNDIHWQFPDQSVDTSRVKFPTTIISVSDTGVGIPAEKLPELFSKFKQLKPSSDHGTGLGLVIAKGIVESHGGQIFVQSKVNEGTAFYFTLPLDT